MNTYKPHGLYNFNSYHTEPFYILFWKQCRTRSAGLRSQLIRIHTVFNLAWHIKFLKCSYFSLKWTLLCNVFSYTNCIPYFVCREKNPNKEEIWRNVDVYHLWCLDDISQHQQIKTDFKGTGGGIWWGLGNHYLQIIANCMIFVKLCICMPELVIFCQIFGWVESLMFVLEYIEH